jgi:hypothetical protein
MKRGASPEFKELGSSPAKLFKPRKKSMNPTGPRDKEGYFETKGDNYSPDVKTKPKTIKTSTGKTMPTGDTEVKTITSNRYTKDGKTYSKVRGPSAERVTETSIVGPKGTQKGKTKVVKDNPISGSDFMASTEERDDSMPFSGKNRKYNPKTRSFR